MATPTLTAHVYPSSGVTTGSGVAWTNPGNAVSENATNATSALTKSATTSQTLRVTGFDFSAIPVGAIITGVEVRVKRSTAGNTVNDNSVRLSLSGASIGTNLASATNYTTSLAWATYGGSNELWGTTLSESQIKDSTFGVDFSAKLSGTTSRTVSVDAISVAVAYLPPGVYLEATDQRDIASGSIEVPVVVSLAATDQRDIASGLIRASTGSVMHVGTGAIAAVQNTNTMGGGVPITVALPSAWLPDDIFIMQLTLDGGPGPTISGWTPLCTAGTTYCFWRRAEAGDTAPTFTVTPNYNIFARANISAWGDALKTGDPFESIATGSVTPPFGGTAACPDVTVTNPGSAIFSVAHYSSGTINFVSPFTNIHQIVQQYSTSTTGARLVDIAGTYSGGSFGSSYQASHNTASFVLMPQPAGEPEPTTVTIAVTDQYDVVSGSATVTGTVSLATTDQRDTASGTVSITGSVSLAVTDQRDVASGSAAITGTVSLAVTDERDTASGSITVTEPSGANKLLVKHAGAWVQPTPRVKVFGDWIVPITWVKKAGTWIRLQDPLEPLAITNTGPLTVEAEQTVSRSFYVENAVGEPSMSVTSYSPYNPGLTFNTTTFSLTGTVYSPGNFTVNLSASDGAGRTATAVFNLTVTEAEIPPI